MSVFVQYSDAVAIMVIDRPDALNALNREMVDQLEQCLMEIEARHELGCLILYGKKNFAAGADIAQMVECNPEEAKAFAFSPVYNRLSGLSIPTIAAVEGYALGGGLELALACDIRICGESAKLGFPEIALGIMPGAGGTIRAPRLIGVARAKELIFTGSTVTAAYAEKIGLVNQVVVDEEVFAAAKRMAEKIASRSHLALQVAKRTILAGMEIADLEAATRLEAENWSGMFDTHDQKEGMRAFLEKRKPEFSNC